MRDAPLQEVSAIANTRLKGRCVCLPWFLGVEPCAPAVHGDSVDCRPVLGPTVRSRYYGTTLSSPLLVNTWQAFLRISPIYPRV